MNHNTKTNWLERPVHSAIPAITNQIALFAGIILLAIITRFFALEPRVMSHDESLHTYFSWLLYRGQGYQHTPMMHGPFQFHIIALTYFLFGVSDFTARIPAVLFNIATIWMVWYWRRYLGNWGALIAGLLLVVSPYVLYYGRYVRNESFTGLAGIVLLYGILRYLEAGEKRYLYFVTLGTILHFITKETAFIYTAQAILFLGVYFIIQITRWPWEDNHGLFRAFVIALVVASLLLGAGAAIGYVNRTPETISGTETMEPVNPGQVPSPLEPADEGSSLATILIGLGASILAAAGVTYFIQAYLWHRIPKVRSFDLLILLGTFVLPMATAFPIDWLKSTLNVTIPTDSASVNALDTRSMTIVGIFVAVFFIISIVIGLLWDRDWWKYGAVFWGIFTIFYTTVFTNAAGFFTGIVGSLGYWLVQQGVERGSQPEYYYVLVQIPMYEFLPAIGTLVGVVLGVKRLLEQRQTAPPVEVAEEVEEPLVYAAPEPNPPMFGTFFGLMLWWIFSSILAFTVAGERMPWLTFHMAWPMALFAGWAIGQIVESLAPRFALEKPGRIGLAILTLIVFVLAAFNTLRSLYGATPPFQGSELVQLQATAAFIFPFITMILTGILLAYLLREDLISLAIVALIILALITLGSTLINGASLMMQTSNAIPDPAIVSSARLRFGAALLAFIGSIVAIFYLARVPRQSSFVGLVVLTIFGLLFAQTMRTSFRASYINYDNATEYMVYAHGATGVKEVMAQVEEISERTAGGLNAIIAYDASAPDTGVSWPMVWYLRDFTALRSFDQPTRSLRDAVAVVVDEKNFDKITPALGDEFYQFDYIRMWWPNQDYFNLDKIRVLNAITNPQLREGIFDIWLDRDYTTYGQATGSTSITLTSWQPADRMRLYVRKDVAAKIWNYGVGPSESPVAVDPYEAGTVMLAADQIFGAERYPPLGLNAPRAIAAGLDGDIYVADSRNHRILHIAADGSLLDEWGSFGDNAAGNAPIGTFNEPWGIAVGPDGSVYVSDTWNHRVQKFSASGEPVLTWGQYGQPLPEVPESSRYFWGPRGLAVDSEGRVFLADTGNKRIVVFDADGNYLTEFGTAGLDPGQFDEPVGVAVAEDGTVYVTDTWNQRIQAFITDESGTAYFPFQQWDVNAWFGQSLENKPFIAVGPDQHVFITDPEGYRVVEFTDTGEFVRTWGDFGVGATEIGLAAGIAVDPQGFVWVTDAGNNRILRYTLPQ
ncbi:MAG TPA: flippase activity-associated protein Agl23 [Anaerolineales bacterium]|nr:flippase activity-associated protein Agl23 [Anaerolineales bacterium]